MFNMRSKMNDKITLSRMCNKIFSSDIHDSFFLEESIAFAQEILKKDRQFFLDLFHYC